MNYLGDFPVNSTVYVPFQTFDSNGASITITGLAVTDIEIYKDGSATQRASDAGYTLLDTDGIDFDGITGIHGFSINLSDNTDASFYAAGHEYWVVVSSITCDTRTINFVAATFSIDRWYNQAITRGQVKITANAANEGALDIRNSNANGHGTLNDGGDTGLYNSGASIGQYNFGTALYGIQASGGTDGISATGTANVGILATGAIAGQYNLGNGGAGYGQYNSGDIVGQYNAASGANSIGQDNQGVAQGQYNNGSGASGIGMQNVGAAGSLNDATADQIADHIWDEAIAGHLAAGSTGATLNAAAAPSAATVADAVWDELIAGHAGAGSTGTALSTAASAGGATPASLWAYASRTLTQSAAQVADIVSGSSITVQRGDSLSAALTGLGAITGYTSLDFTVKANKSDADTSAIIRIRKNASGLNDGLIRLNGEAAATAADGSITIDDMALGNVTIALIATDTATLSPGQGYYYDIQKITGATVLTLTTGTFNIAADVTRLVA